MSLTQTALIVRAAAEQRRWLIPRRRDRNLVAQGGTLLHAVDTDVVKLFTSPWLRAPDYKDTKSGRKIVGYAEIFPREAKDASVVIALGAALANSIFYGLNKDLPLLMLPPMGEEMQDVFAAVARDAEQEGEKALENLAEFRALLDRVDSLEDPDSAVTLLAEHADRIARFLLGQEGAMAELRRFALLLQEARIAPPEYLIDAERISDPVLCPALEPPTDLADRIRYRVLREDWYERLRRHKSRSHSSVLTDSDAQVLARLEWINKKLIPENGSKPKHRVVLITGDHAMHAAAAQHPWGNSQLSFGELFLRHPRAYLAEPGVLAPPEVKGIPDNEIPELIGDTQFDQWLDTWLSELNPGTDDFESELDDLLGKNDAQLEAWVAPLEKTRPQIMQSFRNTWSEYTRNLVLKRDHSPAAMKLMKVEGRNTVEQYSALIDQLDEAIHERIYETWEGCFSVVAESSYSLLRARQQSSGAIPSRNPPLLWFDRFDRPRQFVERVLKSYSTGGLTPDEWDKALRELKSDDESKPRASYFFFLALGLLFAADGIWRVAAILAKRALVIAEREHPPKISGREAAFLRAVALRHSARKARDLAPIANLLEHAEASFDKDISEYLDLKAGPCRFAAERLALYLTYHLFRMMMKEEIPESVPALEQIQTEIDTELDKLHSSQIPEKVRLYTERNLLVNWCMSVLLRVEDETLSPPLEAFASHIDALERNIKNSCEDFPPSYYVNAILYIGALLCAKEAKAAIEARKKVIEWLSPKEIEKHSVMRYDEERFKFLAELANKA